MITLVQPILILVLVAILLIYIRRFRTRLFDRAVIILFLLLGIVMVMFPDLTTVIAHYFGVGRGADLVMYFGLSGFAFASLLLYSKVRDLEKQLTNLVRRTAIEQAIQSSSDENIVRNE